jgi:hypothetical protein
VKTYNAFEFHYIFCAEIVILRKLIAFLVQKMEDIPPKKTLTPQSG